MIFAAYYSGHVPPEASLIEFSSESRQPSLYLPNFLSFRGRKFGSISKGERIWEEGGIKILLLRKGDRGAFLFWKVGKVWELVGKKILTTVSRDLAILEEEAIGKWTLQLKVEFLWISWYNISRMRKLSQWRGWLNYSIPSKFSVRISTI